MIEGEIVSKHARYRYQDVDHEVESSSSPNLVEVYVAYRSRYQVRGRIDLVNRRRPPSTYIDKVDRQWQEKDEYSSRHEQARSYHQRISPFDRKVVIDPSNYVSSRNAIR